jgi:hypothetical protein
MALHRCERMYALGGHHFAAVSDAVSRQQTVIGFGDRRIGTDGTTVRRRMEMRKSLPVASASVPCVF